MTTMLIDWYFDFVSPLSYLQLPRIVAPILDHVGQLGPAEIPSERSFTCRHVAWRARHAGVPPRFPSAHPFNSLRLPRL